MVTFIIPQLVGVFLKFQPVHFSETDCKRWIMKCTMSSCSRQIPFKLIFLGYSLVSLRELMYLWVKKFSMSDRQSKTQITLTSQQEH